MFTDEPNMENTSLCPEEKKSAIGDDIIHEHSEATESLHNIDDQSAPHQINSS